MSTAASHTVTALSYQGQHATMAVIVTGGYVLSAVNKYQCFIVQVLTSAGIA